MAGCSWRAAATFAPHWRPPPPSCTTRAAENDVPLRGPDWQPDASAPGVYVVETSAPFDAAPIELGLVAEWIDKVPTLRLDGKRPSPEALARRLAEFWIPGEVVVYVGLAGSNLRSRVRGFYRTPLGDPRPHAGGHWLKTLRGLESCRVWWVETDEPDRCERDLLEAFATRAQSSATGRAATLVLPFANRENADHVRKPHGISGSTLPRRTSGGGRSSRPTRAREDMAGVAPSSDRGDRLARINAALQAMACAAPDRQGAAVAAARQLDRLGLLRDSPTRPGLPLRKLLREDRIDHAYQEAGRWWFIRCPKV